MSMYRCELWSLSSRNIDDICVAWRKSVRRIWSLPFNTHCELLRALGQCLPVLDEICKRCLRFLYSCVNHETTLIRSVAINGIVYGRGYSLIGRNMMFCLQRYHSTLSSFFSGCMDYVIYKSHNLTVSEAVKSKVGLLYETVYCRDNLYRVNSLLTGDELQMIVEHLCTS
jgi:hypothetical protein